MTGPSPSTSMTPVNQLGGGDDNSNGASDLQEQIQSHLNSLQSLIKQDNDKAGPAITPIGLAFDDDTGPVVMQVEQVTRDKQTLEDGDLRKPLKEVSSRFVGAANQGEWEMPVWCRMFQQTFDDPAREWFDRLPNGSIDNWASLQERFKERFSLRRRCIKDPTEINKIVRKANEALSAFKERWTDETSYISNVPKIMWILAFMTNAKSSELSWRFSGQVPQTVTEMMKRVDDFIKSEEAHRATELPKGEGSDQGNN
nr:reverse transcriptase domain-containing protein [Tanacetum cinerariifolium]GEX96363.1 reverse transcriptase domain-containing protein [Tanacetum cinerariifolium]